MYKIIKKETLAPGVKLMEIEAPAVAEKAMAGQFVVVIADEKGERIPLTIADFTGGMGTVSVVFQEAGRSTMKLGILDAGETIADFIGPLGKPSRIEKYGTVVCIGGGVGIPAAYIVARAMKQKGNRVISIIGARSKDFLVFGEKIREASDECRITTDDGSRGRRGFVSDELKELLDKEKPGLVFAVGPVNMMKSVSAMTEKYGIKTVVSLSPIMVDATGMCGACRVLVGGETKCACVDGPEFDGHRVDFDLLLKRQGMYLDEEKEARDGR